MSSEPRLQSIGVIHTGFAQPNGTPVQSAYANGAVGVVDVFPQYAAGLKDLAGFERIWLLYWLDRAAPAQLEVVPYLDREPHGIFATRSPCRPNPIGMSAVRLIAIEDGRLQVADADMLDGTPLLDIKPYVPAFDAFAAERVGWCARIEEHTRKTADDRFARSTPG